MEGIQGARELAKFGISCGQSYECTQKTNQAIIKYVKDLKKSPDGTGGESTLNIFKNVGIMAKDGIVNYANEVRNRFSTVADYQENPREAGKELPKAIMNTGEIVTTVTGVYQAGKLGIIATNKLRKELAEISKNTLNKGKKFIKSLDIGEAISEGVGDGIEKFGTGKKSASGSIKDAFKDWNFGKDQLSWDNYLKHISKRYNVSFEKIVDELVQSGTHKGLTRSEAESILAYTTIFNYEELNSSLRLEENLAKTMKIEKLMNNALEKLPSTPEGKTLYRGVKINESELKSFLSTHKKGEKVTYKEFTSAADYVSDSFLSEASKNIKIEIIPKKSSNGKNIHDLSFGKQVLGTKNEVLFKSKTEFKIIENKSLGNGHYKILMEEL